MAETRIGFIGLGIMGGPMAMNLLRAGFPLTVYNRTRNKETSLVAEGAVAADSPAATADASDVVITMLPDTPDVESVYFGVDGVFNRVRPGHLLIDMSTVSPAIARKIHQAAVERGADSLDAPVSGGDVGAKAGTLSIMVGGSVDAFERARPIFQAMGKNIVHVGDAGAGQVTKACNQIVVALTIEAVGEALVLAKKSGVDPSRVRQALLGGFAQSRVLDVHGQRALEGRFEPGFRIRLHRKDLTIALEAAQQLEVSVPVTAMVHDMMNSVLAQGWGEQDHSILIYELARRANIDIS
ncbi:2-hydroxy-3-oxopropionate reductase [Sulfobacillus thermosulfidooxidans]|uniref:2-hydroxy-3-oxopropionate reductase n=1 Tax=Sulfobacillus thermosulfidooxidans TaxID=28034 RepID=UPI0006B450C0|nr:2-hydroxy-3-oxopropionate reductase [Sulfobacillus thermosulfidooxidans]